MSCDNSFVAVPGIPEGMADVAPASDSPPGRRFAAGEDSQVLPVEEDPESGFGGRFRLPGGYSGYTWYHLPESMRLPP